MSSSARASDAPAAGGYRRPPHMRGFGLTATLLALAAGTSVAMVTAMHPARPTPHDRALTLFEITPPPASMSPTRHPAAQRAAAPAPAAQPAPPMHQATVAIAAPAAIAMPPAPSQASPTIAMAPPAAQPAPSPAVTPPATAHPDYAARLWSHIAGFRPRGIRLPGTALIAFTVGESGTLEAIHVARSSGNVLLDALALRTVRRASPVPAPPADSAADARKFVIPFTFE